MAKGKAATAKGEEVASTQGKSNNAYADKNRRFWLSKKKTQAEVVILDSSVNECIGFYEHTLQNPKTQFWDTYEACPKEWETCPICESDMKGNVPSYTTFFTVYDASVYTKNGEEKMSGRCLLPIKAAQLSRFMRVLNAAEKQYGTLRGVSLLLERDVNDQQSAKIGEPIMDGDANMFTQLTEDEMLEEFGHEDLMTKDGTVYLKANESLQPFVYTDIFEKPSGDDLRKRYGGGMVAGSQQEAESEFTEEAPTSGRSRSRARNAPADTDDAPFE
jgi:hypothetical protein